MTVSSSTNRVSYNGNGVTKAFSFPHLFYASGDLAVTLVAADGTETSQVETTDYIVSGARDPAGGTVTAVVAPAVGQKLVIVREVDFTQELDLVENDPLPADSLEQRLDLQVMLAQQVKELTDRSIKFPKADSTSLSSTLPAAANRAGKAVVFDASGNVGVSSDDYLDQLAAVTAQADAAGVSAAAASGSAASASGSAASASGSAASASASASAASASASTASAAAAIATTQAGIATAKAVAAEASAGAALASETAAGLSETAAAASAATATTKAGEASTSAADAASAKVAAEAARDSTLAAFDSFDDRYLGAKASDPVVDNDGNALVAGSIYFNTASGAMKVYTGSAWVAAYVSGAGYLAAANNLSDLSSAATARTSLGLGTAATTAATDYATAAQGTKADNAVPSSYLDTDTTLAANSDSKVATQKAVKAYADTKATSAHTHTAADIASGTIATARLGSGSAGSSTYLRGDQTWAAVSAGALEFVSSTTASGAATVDFTGLVSGYDYMVVFDGVYTGSGQELGFRFGTAGPAYQTSGYQEAMVAMASSSSPGSGNSGSGLSTLKLSNNGSNVASTADGYVGHVFIPNPSANAYHKIYGMTASRHSSTGELRNDTFSGYRSTQEVLVAVRFHDAGGTGVSGTFILYRGKRSA